MKIKERLNNLKQKFKNNKKRNLVILVLILILSIGSYLVWANLDSSSGDKYLPEEFATDQSVQLFLWAWWYYNAIDYYPGGYAVFLKTQPNWERILPELYINNPSIIPWTETFWTTRCQWVCDIAYQLKWDDPDLWQTITSTIYWSDFKWQSGWQNIIPKVIERAKPKVNSIHIPKDDYLWRVYNKVLIKTYWADDTNFNWQSRYYDLSKKFALKWPNQYVSYIWIGKSDDLWGSDWKVAFQDMRKLNWASLIVAPGINNKTIKYSALVEPGRYKIHFTTVDMDNIRVDPASSPQIWNSYIDVKLYKRDSIWNLVQINRNWDPTDWPIMRVAPYGWDEGNKWAYTSWINDSHWIIAPLPWDRMSDGQRLYAWDYGPSGSFQCDSSIWDPWFVDCATTNKPMAITQHTVYFPEAQENRVIVFEVHNASANARNAFAMAWDFDMIPNLEITPENPFDPAELWNSWATNTWSTMSWITATTKVEVDPTWLPDYESDFNDSGKNTNVWALHTYKTEVCNYTSWAITNVMVKLHLPQKSTLIWSDTPDDTWKSSLMLNGSNLDATIDAAKKLPIGVFNTDIAVWDLNSAECKYLAYQTKVNSWAINWDTFTVKNEFKYWSEDYNFTNEVSNPLSTDVNCNLTLASNPITGTTISRDEYIEYTVSCKNLSQNAINSGSIDCTRQKDTQDTACKVGECTPVNFIGLAPGATYEYSYSVKVWSDVVKDTVIDNKCYIDYDNQHTESNSTDHTVTVPSSNINGWDFTLELYSRPKLINSANGNPRADEADQSPIQYTYKYTGSKIWPVYPNLSTNGGYSYWNVLCGPTSEPYYPNAYTYNVNSANINPQTTLNPGNIWMTYYLFTELPSDIPKTILYKWTLSPTSNIFNNEINSWYSSWWSRTLPVNTTIHRALVNWRDWNIHASILGDLVYHKWQYVPYKSAMCQELIPGCTWENGYNCYNTRHYNLYRWEVVASYPVSFKAEDSRSVDVTASTARFQTSNWDVHTNYQITNEWTNANIYNLWEAGKEAVKSSPKLYSPPWSFNWDYMVSTNTTTSNISSKAGRYTIKQEKFWYGSVYDRTNNKRDYYWDLIDKQKFGKVVKEWFWYPIKSLTNMQLNTIYYYPGDLTIESPSWTVQIWWQKATIVVWWNLYIKSNLKYLKENKPLKEQPYLWLMVKGHTYISPNVTYTVGAWHVDWTLHTWEAVKPWKHLWQIAVNQIDLQRKADEYNNGQTNAPSERIQYDDQIYFTIPPGFAELDDGSWAYYSNVNQYTWKIVNPWDQK